MRTTKPQAVSLTSVEGLVVHPSQVEAVARLEYLITSRAASGILVGETGLGKTTVLADLQRSCSSLKVRGILLNVAELDAEGLWLELASRLPCATSRGMSESQLARTVEQRLRESALEKDRLALLLDDADRLPLDSHRVITRLLKVSESWDLLLTIIAASRPSRVGRLPAELREACHLKVELDPWEEEETRRFVATRLKKLKFTSSAHERIFRLSEGNPRKLQRLLQLIRKACEGEGQTEVTPDIVDTTYQELFAR